MEKKKKNPKMNGLDPETWKKVPKYMRPFLREGGKCVAWVSTKDLWERGTIRKVWVDEAGVLKARVLFQESKSERELAAVLLFPSVLYHYCHSHAADPKMREAMGRARAVVTGAVVPGGNYPDVDRAKRNISLLLKLEFLRRDKLLKEAERMRDKALSAWKTHNVRGRKRIIVMASCKNCTFYPGCSSAPLVDVCPHWTNREGVFTKYLREQATRRREGV